MVSIGIFGIMLDEENPASEPLFTIFAPKTCINPSDLTISIEVRNTSPSEVESVHERMPEDSFETDFGARNSSSLPSASSSALPHAFSGTIQSYKGALNKEKNGNREPIFRVETKATCSNFIFQSVEGVQWDAKRKCVFISAELQSFSTCLLLAASGKPGKDLFRSENDLKKVPGPFLKNVLTKTLEEEKRRLERLNSWKISNITYESLFPKFLRNISHVDVTGKKNHADFTIFYPPSIMSKTCRSRDQDKDSEIIRTSIKKPCRMQKKEQFAIISL